MSKPSTRPSRLSEGLPYPLGATWDGLGVNFALFSANATKVELCLFDAGGKREIERIVLPEYTDEVWHGYLPDARPGAKQIIGHLQWNPALFGYRMETGDDLSFDERDSAPFTFKACVIDTAFTWGRTPQRRTAWENTVSDPDGEALALRDFGHAYDVPSRALLFFLLQPIRTRDRSTAAERSFQRVVQTMDDASTRSVRFGFD